jgi:imidazolonepropionase-like amidohydrolase
MELSKMSLYLLLVLSLFASTSVFAQQTLITGVSVFDGKSDKLLVDHDVLIEGNLITQLGKNLQADTATAVIDGAGRTLMPGMIDIHSHLCVQNGLSEGRDNWDQMAMGAMTGALLDDFLQQGFTTVRDLGCNTLGIAKAVRLGRINGPRVFSSGGWLSQTGGHADLGRFNDPLHDAIDDLERAGQNHVVDGVPEVMKAARHNFRGGATQLKVMAGGGVSSEFDPLHVTQYSLEELKAIVSVAEDYGSYVSAHAYHDRSINRAIDAGVKVIEHAFLASEETVRRMAKEGIILSLQAEMSYTAFAHPEQITFFSPDQQAKAAHIHTGVVQLTKWARKYGVKTATGGDMFGQGFDKRQADNVIATTKLGYNNLEALQFTTSNAAGVLMLSGEMNPYKKGALGVIEKGAYADLIIVDGNPLEDISVLKRDKVLLVIKDGVIYKNSIAGR